MPKSAHTSKYKKLVVALRAARIARKVTQTELAKRLKKPQSYVAKYEQAERRLDVVEFFAVTDALGVDGAEVLSSVGLLP